MSDDETQPMLGAATGAAETDHQSAFGNLAGTVLVPDAESTSGWRHVWIYKPKPERKPGSAGFQRPGNGGKR